MSRLTAGCGAVGGAGGALKGEARRALGGVNTRCAWLVFDVAGVCVADRTPFIGIEPFDGQNYGTSQLLMSGPPIVRDDGEIWCYYNALRMPGSIEMYRRFNRCKELFRLGIDQRHFDDAGALSRIFQLGSGKTVPTSLMSVARARPPMRDEAWWETMAAL